MKIIALEEHLATPEIIEAWKKADARWRDLALKNSTEGDGAKRLLELGSDRLAAMDEAGIDIAVSNRILFATDYLFAPAAAGAASHFMEAAYLNEAD